MPSRPRENESLLVSGDSLGELSFSWKGDRYHHRWNFPESTCMIDSIESDSADVWPLSPPLQQIHQQTFDDGREVVFGVGMSGRGHWSASFTLVPELESWIIELACRSPVEPNQLMSSYALSGEWQEDSNNLIRCQQKVSVVSLEALAPSCLAQIELTRDRSDSRIRFLPSKIADANTTTQWAFRLRVKKFNAS